MAFVFRSPKSTNFSKNDSETFPLQKQSNSSIINSSSSILNSNINNSSTKPNIAFGKFTEKNEFFKNKKENTPGPGSYEIMTDLIKNKFNINETSPDDGGDHYSSNKRLFISKKDRFDKYQYQTDVPGPGEYLSDKTNFKFKEYNTLTKKSKWQKLEMPIYDTFSTSRILSIPSRGTDFGYEFDNKGNLILIEDPDKNKKFLGTKNSSVGPGHYTDINYISKNSHIGVLDWNKSIHKTKSKKEDKKNVINNNLTEYESSNYFFSNNSTEPTVSNKSISIINYNKKDRTRNYFYNSYLPDKKNFEIKFSNNKIYKNDNFSKTINKKSLSPFFKTDINQEIKNNNLKTEFKDNEAYYSLNNFNDINIKKVKEGYQFFGSSTSRGIMFPKKKLNNNIMFGRNKCQPDKDNIGIISNTLNLSNGLNTTNIDFEIPSKKNKVIIKQIDKVELTKKISKSLKKDSLSYPGPGSYDPKLISKNNFSYDVENFGSLERRFPYYKTTNKEVGILSYIYLDKWGPKKRNNYLKKIIPQNILKKLKEGISINKMNIFRDKIIKEARKQPPVGTYDLEKIYTINSKVKNNANLGKYSPAFGTSTKRKYIIDDIKDDGESVGVKKKIEKNEKKDKKEKKVINLAPFLSYTRRDDIENFEKNRIKNFGGKIGGPGYYKTDSYFDWNKKSYNILFN